MRVVGQEFDPTLHEAVLREPSDAHPEDVVIEDLRAEQRFEVPGWLLDHNVHSGLCVGIAGRDDHAAESRPDVRAPDRALRR